MPQDNLKGNWTVCTGAQYHQDWVQRLLAAERKHRDTNRWLHSTNDTRMEV